MTDTQSSNGIPQVQPSDVPEGARIVDVRQPEEFRAGHVPGAVSIPMGEVRDRVADVPQGDGPVYVMCKAGARSQKAAEFYAEQGIEVINVDGGATAWNQAGRDLVSETGDAPAVIPPESAPPMEV